MVVVTSDWDCNKGTTNPNGVFSGVTRTISGQNGSSNPSIVQYYFDLYNRKVGCEIIYYYYDHLHFN
jgi:hypothetical protein